MEDNKPKVVNIKGNAVPETLPNSEAVDILSHVVGILRERPDITGVMVVTLSADKGYNWHHTELDIVQALGALEFLKLNVFSGGQR